MTIRMVIAATFAGALGCHTEAFPPHPNLVVPDATRSLIGVDLRAKASWTASCETVDQDHGDTHPCNPQEFTFDLRCDGVACTIEDERTELAWVKVIRATSTGDLVVSAEIAHDDERLAGQGSVSIVPPETFVISCHGNPDPTCDGATIPANQDPFIDVMARLDGVPHASHSLVINGSAPASFDPDLGATVDLTTLFPDRAHQGLMEPGLYDLVISLGGYSEMHTIEVR